MPKIPDCERSKSCSKWGSRNLEW